MKKKFLTYCLMMTILSIVIMPINAEALLINRGNNIVFDEEQNLSWYDFSFNPGFADWSYTEAWINQLEYSGFSDWRAPTIDELQYLGRVEFRDTSNYENDPFENVGFNGAFYLSSTIYGSDQRYAYSFLQDRTFATWPVASIWGVAVRDGDATVPTPEPGSLLLLGCGLSGLAIFGRKKVSYH